MKHCEATCRRAERILDRFAEWMAPERLSREVDEPIDRALESFRCPEGLVTSGTLFHRTIGRFVQHVEHALTPAGSTLPIDHAVAEGIELLERTYMGAQGQGYFAARLDAADPSGPGMPLVLSRLAERIKEQRRAAIFPSTFDQWVDPTDWTMLCALANLLQKRLADVATDELRRCPLEQLASCIPELLALDLDVRLPSSLPMTERPSGPLF
jgi:hypothetical protein